MGTASRAREQREAAHRLWRKKSARLRRDRRQPEASIRLMTVVSGKKRAATEIPRDGVVTAKGTASAGRGPGCASLDLTQKF